MSEECPMLTRIESLEHTQKEQGERVAVLEAGHERHEQSQEKMAETMEGMSDSVKRLADSVDKLVGLIPIVTTANNIRAGAVWALPICTVLSVIAGGMYWIWDKFHG